MQNILDFIDDTQNKITEEKERLNRARDEKKRIEEELHQKTYNNTVKVILDIMRERTFTYKGKAPQVSYNPHNTAMPSLRVILEKSHTSNDIGAYFNIKAWEKVITTAGEAFNIDQTEEALKAFFADLIKLCD